MLGCDLSVDVPVVCLAGGPAQEQCRHTDTVHLCEHRGADTGETRHLETQTPVRLRQTVHEALSSRN